MMKEILLVLVVFLGLCQEGSSQHPPGVGLGAGGRAGGGIGGGFGGTASAKGTADAYLEPTPLGGWKVGGSLGGTAGAGLGAHGGLGGHTGGYAGVGPYYRSAYGRWYSVNL